MGKDLRGKEIGRGICQRKNGTYQARVFKPGYGKPVYIYNKNLKELKKEKSDLEHTVRYGDFPQSNKMTVDDWFSEWMFIYCTPNLKNTTIRNYVNSYNRIKPYVGYFKLENLGPANIKFLIDSLSAQRYALSTIQGSLTLLYSMLQKAFELRMIPYNPCEGVKVKSHDHDPPKEEGLKRLNEKELSSFFQICKNTRYYEVFLILLNTGLRIGELCALEWKDVDLENRILHINKTLNRTPSYHTNGNSLDKGENMIQITSPKKKSSCRYVPLNDDAIAAFQTWVCKQDQDRKKYKKTWGQSNPLFAEYPDLVFTTENGNAYLPVYAQAECKRIEKIINNKEKISAGEEKRKPEYTHIYPHIFRHTFISCCVESGMSPVSIMSIAGHSDEKMLKHYSHISTDYSQDEFKKFTVHIKTTEEHQKTVLA